ncbi:MAG: outer membrane beta-barrel protein [Pseudomonadales bacterium]
MNRNRFVDISAVICLLALTLQQAAQAQEDDSAPDTLRVFVGGFAADLETDSLLTRSGMGGQQFSMEDDLGLDDEDVIAIGGLRWRIGKRHSIGVMHLALDRDASETLTREVAIGDEVFPINARTETTFDYRTTQFDYRYSFIASDRLNAGVLIGISAIDFDFEVVGDAIGPGGGMAPVSVEEDEAYPVPSIGLGFRYTLAENWYLRAGATYLEYDDGDWEGTLLIAGIGVEWFPWRHFGFGVGYDLVQIEYDEDEDDDSDEFDVEFDYEGIQLRVIARF